MVPLTPNSSRALLHFHRWGALLLSPALVILSLIPGGGAPQRHQPQFSSSLVSSVQWRSLNHFFPTQRSPCKSAEAPDTAYPPPPPCEKTYSQVLEGQNPILVSNPFAPALRFFVLRI